MEPLTDTMSLSNSFDEIIKDIQETNVVDLELFFRETGLDANDFNIPLKINSIVTQDDFDDVPLLIPVSGEEIVDDTWTDITESVFPQSVDILDQTPSEVLQERFLNMYQNYVNANNNRFNNIPPSKKTKIKKTNVVHGPHGVGCTCSYPKKSTDIKEDESDEINSSVEDESDEVNSSVESSSESSSEEELVPEKPVKIALASPKVESRKKVNSMWSRQLFMDGIENEKIVKYDNPQYSRIDQNYQPMYKSRTQQNDDHIVTQEDVKVLMTDKGLSELKRISYTDALNNNRITVEDSCPICLVQFDSEDDKALIDLPCDHVTHEECVIEHFTSYSYRCPVCRADCGDHAADFNIVRKPKSSYTFTDEKTTNSYPNRTYVNDRAIHFLRRLYSLTPSSTDPSTDLTNVYNAFLSIMHNNHNREMQSNKYTSIDFKELDQDATKAQDPEYSLQSALLGTYKFSDEIEYI